METATFFSKKNTVRLVGGRVIKTFRDIQAYESEARIYETLQGRIDTPRVLQHEPPVLTLEYINGPNLLEILERAEKGAADAEPVFIKLCEFIKHFHEITGLILYDVNLRNFILRDDRIFGLDFEDAQSGDPEYDYVRLCAFIRTYDPQDTPLKLRLCKMIAKTTAGDGAYELLHKVEDEAAAFNKRRR